MKILIVVTKGEIGGAQMSVLNLAIGFKEKGEDVTVGFGDGYFLPAELGKRNIKFVNLAWLKRTHHPLANIRYIWEIKKLIDKEKYDVIHFNSSNSLFGCLGAKLSRPRPKTVFTFRGLSMLDENYESGFLMRLLYKLFFRILIKFIDHPVFVSVLNEKRARDNKITVKGTVIHNGLDPERIGFLERSNARTKLGKMILKDLDSCFLIGSIGRLAYPKNYEFLIESFLEIKKIKPDAILTIIGEGSERHKYENMISELSLSDDVILVGAKEDAARYMKAFDLFMLPSKFEGLSITLIEALFAGIPILTSRVGGSPELLENDQCQLFESNDTKDFLEKFQKIIDPGILTGLSLKNIETAKNFTLEKTVNEYLRIYSSKA